MLGQHVYIEMDEGQTQTKDGIWLFSSYVVTDEDGSSYVWADNGNNKLEKRTVELGEYDEELDEYEIVSGLSETDYITYPMSGLYEGVTTVTDIDEIDYTSPLYTDDTEDEYSDTDWDDYEYDEDDYEYDEDDYEYDEDDYGDDESEDGMEDDQEEDTTESVTETDTQEEMVDNEDGNE
jgi:HlyD family secretion protein